jgi:hypothetical protein
MLLLPALGFLLDNFGDAGDALGHDFGILRIHRRLRLLTSRVTEVIILGRAKYKTAGAIPAVASLRLGKAC